MYACVYSPSERKREGERRRGRFFFLDSVPFLDSHASHLAFPLKSNIPGLSTVVGRWQAEGNVQSIYWRHSLCRVSCCSAGNLTSVDISNVGLLKKAVEVQKFLVCGPRLHFLHICSNLLKLCLQTHVKDPINHKQFKNNNIDKTYILAGEQMRATIHVAQTKKAVRLTMDLYSRVQPLCVRANLNNLLYKRVAMTETIFCVVLNNMNLRTWKYTS